MKCTHCGKNIPDALIVKHAASLHGKAKSEAKTLAARANAKKGGWVKGRKRKPENL